jgi:hypothetical protein
MNCTICKSKLIVSAVVLYGSGQELDCPNPKCDWRITDSFIVTKHNWWFAHTYQLPFSIGDKKYFVYGPAWSDKSIVHSYGNTSSIPMYVDGLKYIGNIQDWNVGAPNKTIMEIDYMALPTNEDFEPEFTKLKNNIQKYLLLQ